MSEQGGLDVASSVGRALSSNVALSSSHPFYRTLSDMVEARVSAYAAERGSAKASARLSLVTVALTNDELGEVTEMFPEFRAAVYPSMRPAHAKFVQVRRMATEWLLLQAAKVSDSVAVFGTPLVASIESGIRRVEMVVDPASPVSVHERHSVSIDAYRLYGDHVSVSQATGVALSRGRYDDHLRGVGVNFQTSWDMSSEHDVLCVDGYLNAYSTWQVALAMVTSGAKVAYGFVPYHPVMLMDAAGEVPGYGINFSFTSEEVLFDYPEGVSGVTAYDKVAWQSWLTAHTVVLRAFRQPRFFQLELLKHRGCAMFYRLTALTAAPKKFSVRHSLELPSEVPMYVVSSARLKGIGCDPRDPGNWNESHYMVSQRLVDRVYQFAMQLPREQFTRYAIRKQLHVVNDRVTIEGTSVQVNSRLGEELVDALVVDIFSRAFVDRYDAGTLTAATCEYVKTFAGFHELCSWQKIWYVACTTTVAAWDVTLAPINGWIRDVADAVRSFFSPALALQAPIFQKAPSYMLTRANVRAFMQLGGGKLAAEEIDRLAALRASGFFSSMLRPMAAALDAPVKDLRRTGFKASTYGLFETQGMRGGDIEDVVRQVRGLNEVDEAPLVRRTLEVASATRRFSTEREMDYAPVADPVYVLNEFYSEALPGVAEQELEYDTASVSLDPQDRTLMAPYMKLPKYFGDAPRSRSYYKSRLRALNVPKRQQTLQELLSAVAARNLNAPQVGLPQDDKETAVLVWENFLSVACHEDARSLLEAYGRDSVSLEEEALREWASQSTPEKIASVKAELEKFGQSLGEMPVHEYLLMLKADVKPTLSRKPLDTRTEPQVIVYHEKALSALFSSMFRVLVRRFLALLKPNYHVNLLKDTADVEAFIQGVHPFGAGNGALRYLENDFSKYDKSQGKFVFVLEELVFRALGLNEESLKKWMGGHVECSIRAVALGLSLHVMYQRKSGDATTSFGNVLLNILSVSYAYRGTEVVWGVFMGDDSLVCARGVAHEDDAVKVLAEVFNLGAKTYLTLSPYFASNFVLVDSVNEVVHLVPDPVKRIERMSMAVSADDPQWVERYTSARDSMRPYLCVSKTALLPRLVADRYAVGPEAVSGVADAMATLLRSAQDFRAVWEEFPELSLY